MLPDTYGYTEQRTDAETRLDYYNARYYDASAGQFASADTARDGLNRYGYVHGNPTTMTDPSGHGICPFTANSRCVCKQDCGGSPPPPCTQNCSPGGNPPPPPGGGGGNPPKSGPPISALEYDHIMGLCSQLPDFICNIFRSMVSAVSSSSLSRYDWGNILRRFGVILAVIGLFVGVADVIYTMRSGFDKSKSFELALELVDVVDGGLSVVSAWPGATASVVYGIMAALSAVLIILCSGGILTNLSS